MNKYSLKLGLIIGVILFPIVLCAQRNTKKRPNILVLMTDDQTYYSINAMGNKEVRTPNLDKLVLNGVTFMNNYATTSICMASRACLMTGMYEYKTGCNFMHGPLAPEKFEKSYPVLLKQNGYYTGFGGKLGFAVTNKLDLAPRFMNKDQYLPSDKFDSWAGVGHTIYYKTNTNTPLKKYAEKYPHLTRALGAYGMDFIDEAVSKDKPFCLSIYFKAPHGELNPDTTFNDVYKNTSFSKPSNYGVNIGDRIPVQALVGRQHLQYFHKYDNNYQDYIKKINQLIYGVDCVVGEFMNKLKKLNIDKNTIIIFTSDNGFSLGSHGLYAKLLPYEECSKVPLIIYDPMNTKHSGMKTNSLTANVDVTATILDYAGVEEPKNMDGISLRPIVENPSNEVRYSLPNMNLWGNPQQEALTINTKNWKYTYWGYAEDMTSTETLYNKVMDPFELHNLANDPNYKLQLEKMRTLYDRQLVIWKQNCVTTGEYDKYPIFFSRSIPWSIRKDYMHSNSWSYYENLIKSINYKGDIHDYNALLKFGEKQKRH